ncbi:unnamed protein product [Spirodela intermedia]|uniref:Uncharacterized protein n=1 Tax=Spirodela intermedia TaxID=51605 RepID=A0A7I8I7T1_SPIIN|nr:unnamed protein product [Spirodela intermedia]CAA6653687.1 unnamed protein product [Spirodela intermedia]
MSLNALNHSIYPKLRLRREKNHGNILSKLGSKVTEGSLVLMPVLLSLLKHEAAIVVRQSIVCGTRFFCTVLEEIAQQLQFIGEVGRWLEDMWVWMVKFKDAVYSLASEPGPASVRALAVKFLEVYVLLFTSNASGHEGALTEVGLHPIFERSLLSFEVNKCLGLLLNLLLSASTAPVSLTIVVISCLSAIARKRPVYYDRILSALLAFDPDSQTIEGGHAASIRYSLKTAFVGFLRCTHHPSISESREKLIRALRSLNPGEATEHIIRQIDKMAKNAEHISRDARLSKDDRTSGQPLVPGDTISKRSMMLANDGIPFPDDVLAKRARHGVTVSSAASVPLAKDLARDVDDGSVDAANGFSSKLSLLDSDLTPAEQMIVMVGALLAEGERGAESLDILISQMQADLLADMVIVNMKYLPKTPSPLFPSLAATATVDTSDMSSQILSSPTSGFNLSTSTPDTPPAPNTVAEAKRDPRRDPRRLDPRRSTATVGAQPVGSNMETDSDVQPGLDGLTGRAMPSPVAMKTDSSLVPLISKSEVAVSDISTLPDDKSTLEESPAILDQTLEKGRSSAVQAISDVPGSPIHVEPELETLTPSETTGNDSVDVSMLEPDHSSTVSSALVSEEPAHELPSPPLFIDLTDEQRKSLSALAVARITESYKVTRATGYTHERLCLLARLVSQVDASGDIIDMLEKYIVKDYHHQKGHELAMYILYHLHSVIVSDTKEQCDSSATGIYEKFLLGVAKFLCNILPASDKSFSRLLNEAPLLPDSIMKLLEDLCRTLGHDHQGKDTREGTVLHRCAVDSQDEVRGKAIRLVANKLHPLSFVTESIEQFAKNTILSLVDQRVPDKDLTLRPSSEQGMEVESQESSSNDSRMLDSGPVEGENSRNAQLTSPTTPAVSLTQAQKYSSLFFALCIKKPQLLQLVFDVYGRAPKVVKQSIHWHVSDLARKLGPSCPELLHIISVFPDGSENLMALVLQVLTEEMTPSADLITTVKQLHQSKLKDAAILIPILSSLSKDEVLPIFPRLVDLPTEKFQTALARILQGSAHTGPALTPAEVLVAIHDINPEKDGVPLKKIMDACTTCFEQRTVFTQHVLVKALDELIKRTPLPLLFMRTVIQAIDAFPAMVDFVMEILSKLVTMQIWRMPKLWPGFLKCASQTQPHSFNVLLKLENVLQKHPNIRSLLSSHASQGNISSSLPRYLNRICTIKHHRRIIKCPCLTDGPQGVPLG